MRSAAGWAWKALIVIACVAYQSGVYVSVSNGHSGLLPTILMWLPLAVLAGWILARARNKPLWLSAVAAAGILVHLVEREERLGLAATSGLFHAAAYLFLLWFFGRTLARGREPLISRFARIVHCSLDPEMALFTRNVTMAWCGFFGLQLIASALLFAFSTTGAWSLFVNVLNLPLVALMFVGQFVYGRIRYPESPPASLWRAVRAYTEDASPSNRAEVR
jgi:uncharacterized membrane protein